MENKMMWEIDVRYKRLGEKTDRQIVRAIYKMKKRHPKEDWIIKRKNSVYNEWHTYYRMEFVYWLEEVYFAEGYYLDKEIAFYRKQIARLEEELGITPTMQTYYPTTPIQLQIIFKKDMGSIRMAIQRMKDCNNNQYVKKDKDGSILIEPRGVKWITENYYRKEYLKELEDYKLELQLRKRHIEFAIEVNMC